MDYPECSYLVFKTQDLRKTPMIYHLLKTQ